tara:strand:+ start:1503 stop:2435 length:933 start_codon:yes stop_codon:yes gene_type:complete
MERHQTKEYHVISDGILLGIYVYICAALANHERNIPEHLRYIDTYPSNNLVQEDSDADSPWEFDASHWVNDPEKSTDIVPFSHGGHANIMLIRRCTDNKKTDIEIYDPYGPMYRWEARMYPEASRNRVIKNMRAALLSTMVPETTTVIYPSGVHPQQVQIERTTTKVMFNEDVKENTESWVDNLCMFWSALVVLLWYKTSKKLSLDKIGSTLALAMKNDPGLDISTGILPFVDYLSRVGTKIYKSQEENGSEPVDPNQVKRMIQDQPKPDLIRTIQTVIQKSACKTQEGAMDQLMECIKAILKDFPRSKP